MTPEQPENPTTIEELLLRLVDPRPNSFGGWTTRCPCNAAHLLLVRPQSQPGRLLCANGCSAGLLRTALGFDPEIVGLDPPEAQFNENSKSTASRAIVIESNEPESRLKPEISTPTAVPDFLIRPKQPLQAPASVEKSTPAPFSFLKAEDHPAPSGEPQREAQAVVKPRKADLEAEIKRLHAEGLSNREIARRVQMHHTSVGRILKFSATPLPEIRR